MKHYYCSFERMMDMGCLGGSVAVKRQTSAQVMVLWSVGSSPASDSVLTAQGLELASDSVSPSLPLLCSHSVSLSLSLTKIKECLKKIKSDE